mmetsp:Transcript_145451/g.362707  ORF Transcript_145451/g.362707 Transcript_145451/m.362707 type:complete len:291 (+) Transcript_145451:101-973(+)
MKPVRSFNNRTDVSSWRWRGSGSSVTSVEAHGPGLRKSTLSSKRASKVRGRETLFATGFFGSSMLHDSVSSALKIRTEPLPVPSGSSFGNTSSRKTCICTYCRKNASEARRAPSAAGAPSPETSPNISARVAKPSSASFTRAAGTGSSSQGLVSERAAKTSSQSNCSREMPSPACLTSALAPSTSQTSRRRQQRMTRISSGSSTRYRSVAGRIAALSPIIRRSKRGHSIIGTSSQLSHRTPRGPNCRIGMLVRSPLERRGQGCKRSKTSKSSADPVELCAIQRCTSCDNT